MATREYRKTRLALEQSTIFRILEKKKRVGYLYVKHRSTEFKSAKIAAGKKQALKKTNW